MLVLAQISDIHLPFVSPPSFRELLSKRASGYANWLRGRHEVHRDEVLDKLIPHMLAKAPDHVAVTGDMVNVAAACEWPRARAFLESLGPSEVVTVIPGNHDAYVRAGLPKIIDTFGSNMLGDNHQAGASKRDVTSEELQQQFPFVRIRGHVALIACSTAVPTAPLMATGELGAGQRERLAQRLNELGSQDLIRVILIHHPPVPGLAHGRRRMTDEVEFQKLLLEQGAELVLHGHNHTATAVSTPGPNREIPVIGVPSASARAHGTKPAAQYNLFHIEGTPNELSIRMERHGLARDETDDVTLIEDVVLA